MLNEKRTFENYNRLSKALFSPYIRTCFIFKTQQYKQIDLFYIQQFGSYHQVIKVHELMQTVCLLIRTLQKFPDADLAQSTLIIFEDKQFFVNYISSDSNPCKCRLTPGSRKMLKRENVSFYNLSGIVKLPREVYAYKSWKEHKEDGIVSFVCLGTRMPLRLIVARKMLLKINSNLHF